MESALLRLTACRASTGSDIDRALTPCEAVVRRGRSWRVQVVGLAGILGLVEGRSGGVRWWGNPGGASFEEAQLVEPRGGLSLVVGCGQRFTTRANLGHSRFLPSRIWPLRYQIQRRSGGVWPPIGASRTEGPLSSGRPGWSRVGLALVPGVISRIQGWVARAVTRAEATESCALDGGSPLSAGMDLVQDSGTWRVPGEMIPRGILVSTSW